MNDELLDMLRCPESHQRLIPLTARGCKRLNAKIAKGEIKDASGNIVTEPIDDGLVTEDDRWLYPVRAGVPDLHLTDRIPFEWG